MKRSRLREIIKEEMNKIEEALKHNKELQDFLSKQGIKANVKRIDKGTMKKTWRLYGKGQKWTPELQNKLTKLGFKDFDGRPLNPYSGNGGMFSVFVRKPDDIKITEDCGCDTNKNTINEEWKGWNEKMPVQLVGIKNGKITNDGSGVQVFKNLADVKKLFSGINPTKGCSKFTWAMKGNVNGKPAIRFETWKANEKYST